MPRQNGEKVVPEAGAALDRFKWEVAEHLGLADKVRQVGWENMTTREVGMIGGMMVRQMIAAAEESLRNLDDPQRPGSAGGGNPHPVYESPESTEGV